MTLVVSGRDQIHGRSLVGVRSGMGVLTVLDAVVGLWASLAPRSFYNSFPGAGLRWVSPLGPYNEHLVTDTGGSYLMMTVLLGLAAATAHRQTVRVALLSVAVQALAHLGWHLAQLKMLDTASAISLVTILVLAVLLPAGLLPLTIRRRDQPEPEGT